MLYGLESNLELVVDLHWKVVLVEVRLCMKHVSGSSLGTCKVVNLGGHADFRG